MARIWVSIGSNVDREASIRGALRLLEARFGKLVLSRVYESDAVGASGPPFYNLVAGFETGESPAALKRIFRDLENRFGRVRDADKNAPRTLDVDLLTYGDRVLHDGNIELPRDEITRYAFVLGPLAEVAPDDVHPLEQRTFQALWADFDQAAQPLRLVDFQ